jgi:NAD+ diphosphatase
LILFLGVDDQNKLASNGTGAEPFKYKEYYGSPYFAVDVTPKGTLADAANGIIEKLKEKGLTFGENSPRSMGLAAQEGQYYTAYSLQTNFGSCT